MIQFLRSVAFWLVFLVSTIILASILSLSFPLPSEKRFAIPRLWSRLNIGWLQFTCNLRYEVQGLENIPETPCIVFSKHQSSWETLAMNFWFHPQSWVLKRELLWLPFFGWGLYMTEPIALNRSAGKRAVQQLIEQGRERLDKKRWVIIFPEGTRIAPGKRGRYKIGGAALAEQTGYPITPVAHNSGEYWARREFVKKPGVIQVRIGPPIESKGKTAQQISAQAEQWIESEMAKITTLEHHQHGAA